MKKVTWIEALGSAAILGIATGVLFNWSLPWKLIVVAAFVGLWMRKEMRAIAAERASRSREG